MSIAALSFVVDRSSAPMFGTVTLPVKLPVTSTVLTSLSDRTVLARMSLGSVRAGAAGACAPQAASRSDATLAIATRLSRKRRVTGSPRMSAGWSGHGLVAPEGSRHRGSLSNRRKYQSETLLDAQN